MNLTKNKKIEVKDFLKEMKANRTNQSTNKPTAQQNRSNSLDSIASQKKTQLNDKLPHSSNFSEDSRSQQHQLSKNFNISQKSSLSQYGSNIHQNFNYFDSQPYKPYNHYSPTPYLNSSQNRNYNQRKIIVPQPQIYNVPEQILIQHSNPFPLKNNVMIKRLSQSQRYNDYDSYQNGYNQSHHYSNFIQNNQSQFSSNTPNYYNSNLSNQYNQGSMHVPKNYPINNNRTVQKINNNSPYVNYQQKIEPTKIRTSKQNNFDFHEEQSSYLNNYSNFSQMRNMEPIHEISDGCNSSDGHQSSKIQNPLKIGSNINQNQTIIKPQNLRSKNQVLNEQKTFKKQLNFVSKDFQICIQSQKKEQQQQQAKFNETKIKKGNCYVDLSLQAKYKEGITKVKQSLPIVKNFLQACKQQLNWIERQRQIFQQAKNYPSTKVNN